MKNTQGSGMMPIENNKTNDGKSSKKGKLNAKAIVENCVAGSIIQQSAKSVSEQKGDLWGSSKIALESILISSIASQGIKDGTAKKALDVQRATYAAYLENTILSDTYMNAMTNKVANNINEAIEKATTEKMNSIAGGAISSVDNILSSGFNKLGNMSTSVQSTVDPIIKLDIQNSVTSALSGLGAGKSITGILESNPITSWLAAPMGAVINGITQGVAINIASSPFGQEIMKIQTQILQQVALVQTAIANIQAEILKIKMAVEAFKNRIYMAATSFVQSIIAPIKAAVVNAIQGIMSGVTSAIKDSISGLFNKSDKKNNATENPASQEGGASS